MDKSQIEAALHAIILSNPQAISDFVGEELGFLGFDGINAGHLVVGQLRDENFAGKLANYVGPSFEQEYSNLDGDKRAKVAKVLETAISILPVVQGFIDPKKEQKPTPNPVAVKTKEDQNSKILGMPKPVFFLGLAVLLLIGFYVVLSKRG